MAPMSPLATEDALLLTSFLTRTLPKPEWTHRCHVRVAWCLLCDSGSVEAAIPRVREGIRLLNESHGVPNTPDGGYHETITVAMTRVIASTMRVHGDMGSSAAFYDANPHLHTHLVLRLYYSKERMMTSEARASFVRPDLAPLPG